MVADTDILSTKKRRGRPPKPKPPKGAKGRPRTPFLSFPDRYVLAIADAIEIATGEKTKNAVRIAVFQSVIDRFTPANAAEQKRYDDEIAKNPKAGCIKIVSRWKDYVRKDGGIVDTKPGCRWQNVESRVQYLLKKRREYAQDKTARKWRAKMCAAFAVPFGRKFSEITFANVAEAKHFALWKAREVGEDDIAIRVIHPMIERARADMPLFLTLTNQAASNSAPDFSLIFGSDT